MHLACNKSYIIWHVLFEHCNICCVRLGRVHWPTAMTAYVPVALVRSPLDMDRCGNHGNQSRGERRVQLVGSLAFHAKELERNKEVGVTSPSCRLNHKQIMAFYQQQSSQCDVSPSLLSTAQCLAFSAAQGEQHGESGLFRGRQVTVLSLLA